jgi:hypothetical protein
MSVSQSHECVCACVCVCSELGLGSLPLSLSLSLSLCEFCSAGLAVWVCFRCCVTCVQKVQWPYYG